jgi:hypothetical protein
VLWGLLGFMGCGDPERGDAWTFTCPPGHRIVGYSARHVVYATDTDNDSDHSGDIVPVATDADEDEGHSDESGSVEPDVDDDGDHSDELGSTYISSIRFITADFGEPSS